MDLKHCPARTECLHSRWVQANAPQIRCIIHFPLDQEFFVLAQCVPGICHYCKGRLVQRSAFSAT
ncbi:hypothetical protein CY34DRAFT_800672 [Suillus luteus UH-Slu-Lm8-n1]|uniref:Uncharacterized protein n=1 Tax=Suillus luteus UH-Slu-Lm8-n1 TaxID=930992 RepID=A0A0D0A7T7_9AGAM|nr:hypothetical protein CY34DRAFT_800672 [Suillus luteus UH-Slu-Lm8-n1]